MKRSLSLLLPLAILGLSREAQADDKDAAKSEFRQGLELMKAGQAGQACPHFAEAHRLDPKVGHVVNLARCEGKVGQLVRARDHWKAALVLANATSDDRRAEVERGLEAAEKDVPRLALELPNAAGLSVTIDERAVSPDEIAAGIAVDLGAHRVVVSEKDHLARVIEAKATRPGERVTLVVAPLESAASASTSPPRAAEPARVPPHVDAQAPILTSSPTPPRRGEIHRMVGTGLLGAGATGLGLGVYFALRARGKNADADCPSGVCQSDEAFRLRSEARESGDLATVAFIAGGALAAAGAVLWIVAPSAHAERVGVVVGPGNVMLRGTY